jgi:hypothetical protein
MRWCAIRAIQNRPLTNATDDLHTLWQHASSPANAEHSRPWNHAKYDAAVEWMSDRPAANSQELPSQSKTLQSISSTNYRIHKTKSPFP